MTPLDLAQVFEGEAEIAGDVANPFIVWCLRSCDPEASDDEIPWCGGFISRMCALRHLPYSRSLRARSWLRIGTPTDLADAVPGYDVAILKRGHAPQPGPEVIAAPGHVGFYAGRADDGGILIYGGNQSNKVGTMRVPIDQILGIRRLA